ncbi:DUF7263 family protein [Haloplanus halophilus]|uniref:DUF7263 family protein n=1 Tax=Haloplanus halophilus TaxID=2949993 RepID=UPI00203E7453|nr:hypothetical protein [Haloplanus sp. GDY1]
MRGQTNLLALAVALVLLTGATVVGVSLADSALAGADRDPVERHAAAAVADRLTAADSPITVRANALNDSRVETLNASRLAELAPPATEGDVRVALGGRTLVSRGSPGGGWTVRRSVVVVDRSGVVVTPANLTRRSTVRIPRGVGRANVTLDPGPNTTVRSVSADGRVVLYDGAGLNTTATVRLSRYEPTTLRVGTGANATGRIEVTYRRPVVDERILTVTVDA